MLPLPSKAELLTDLALVEQAYGATPQLPPGFTLIGMIEADRAITAKLLALEGSIHLPLFRKLFAPDMAPWGFVAHDGSTSTVHVCIRGTETEMEWAEDANAGRVAIANGPSWPGARVHDGFQLVFGAIRGSLSELMLRGHAAREWRFQGHSLGCPLAAQARMLPVSATIPYAPARSTQVRLWAPPRLGNAAYCAYWNSDTPGAVSIINPHDIVPKLPPPELGYGNLGQQMRLTGCGGSLLDLKAAHSLQLGYTPGINALSQ